MAINWGRALVAVAVVERFKQLSMSWTVRGDEKKKNPCREVAVSGGSTVLMTCGKEPRYNEMPREWQNLFDITGIRYIGLSLHI